MKKAHEMFIGLAFLFLLGVVVFIHHRPWEEKPPLVVVTLEWEDWADYWKEWFKNKEWTLSAVGTGIFEGQEGLFWLSCSCEKSVDFIFTFFHANLDTLEQRLGRPWYVERAVEKRHNIKGAPVSLIQLERPWRELGKPWQGDPIPKLLLELEKGGLVLEIGPPNN